MSIHRVLHAQHGTRACCRAAGTRSFRMISLARCACATHAMAPGRRRAPRVPGRHAQRCLPVRGWRLTLCSWCRRCTRRRAMARPSRMPRPASATSRTGRLSATSTSAQHGSATTPMSMTSSSPLQSMSCSTPSASRRRRGHSSATPTARQRRRVTRTVPQNLHHTSARPTVTSAAARGGCRCRRPTRWRWRQSAG